MATSSNPSSPETIALAYTKGPDIGPPVVFLHGVTRCGACFTSLLAAIQTAWTTYAVDHRGHGRSPRASRYRVIDYVPDAVAFLRDVVREPAILFGHSLGAMVAARVAASAPDLVRGVILEDPPFHTMGDRIHETPLLDYFRALGTLAGTGATARQIAETEISNGLRIGDIRDPSTLRLAARFLRDVDPAVLAAITDRKWLEGYHLLPIPQPVLLFQADSSAGGMLTDHDAATIRNTTGCTQIQLKKVGHQAHWIDTAAVLRPTLEFLLSLS